MEKNSKEILNLLEKIKKYLNLKFYKFNIISSGLVYFSPFGQNISLGLMKSWIKKKKIVLINFFIKEIYSLINFYEYQILYSNYNKQKYKKMVITWGTKKNFDNKGIFYDNYFNTNSSILKDTLWLVIYNDKNINLKINDNIILYVKKKKNYLSNIIYILKTLIFNFYSFNKTLNLLSWQYLYSIKLIKNIKTILFGNLKLVLLPYEGQPFQTFLIDFLRRNNKDTSILGFIHSYPSLPSHLIKRKVVPDKIIVSCKDQVYCLKKYFLWNSNDIKYMDSARFIKKEKISMNNKIYLPINFNSVEKLSRYFSNLVDKLNQVNFKNFEVKNHPHSLNSKKHQKLIANINKKIFEVSNNNLDKKNENFSIFIGSTGSIIEALDNGISIYHICEDEIFESYDSMLWPSISSSVLERNIFRYEKKNNKNLINLGNENTFFSYFQNF